MGEKRFDTIVVRETLEAIREQSGGTLRAEAVVEAARGEDSVLHRFFTWNDGEAGERWRLEEARRLIRYHVLVAENLSEPVRLFVSLREDRPGGEVGYRSVVDVMNDEELRAKLLNDARGDMNTFRKKYRSLIELSGVIAAMDDAAQALAPELAAQAA